MISSSYFPPPSSNSSTPQRGKEATNSVVDGGSVKKSNVSSVKSASPLYASTDFKSMPVTELLSSANSRSAFLQSLQRSREREELREKELQRQRESGNEREKAGGYFGTVNGEYRSYELSNNYASDSSKDSYSAKERDQSYSAKERDQSYIVKDSYSAKDPYAKDPCTKDSYTKDPYSAKDPYTKDFYTKDSYNKDSSTKDLYTFNDSQTTNNDSYGSASYDTRLIDNYNPSGNAQSGGTPIMSRRRLSSSSSSAAPSKPSTPPKLQTNATPQSQTKSKLASHAFTLSRSSTSEEELCSSSNKDIGSIYFDTSKQDAQLNVESNNIRALIESVIESHTATLKNDLQNLHIELIKQSVAQQGAFRSLLETYLPLTGKLMETLKETREENERLKMRIEELASSMRRQHQHF